RDSRMPVKIMGMAEGSTIIWIWRMAGSPITRLTLMRSLSTPATPTVVLMTVGQRQHRATVIAEVTKDLLNIGFSETYSALTTMVTRGNQARGDTGLKSWMIGLTAL